MGRRYPHLSLEERRKTAKLREAKIPVPQIANRLGRAPSTIYRELKRNRLADDELPYLSEYFGVNAQRNASGRRVRRRKLIPLDDLRAYVINRLIAGWSLKQIAGHLAHDNEPIQDLLLDQADLFREGDFGREFFA